MKNPELATAFHALHRGPELLLLANAWDAGSARLAHAAGARAIATSSAAVAWAHGWPDGDRLPVELLLQTARAMAASHALARCNRPSACSAWNWRARAAVIGSPREAGAHRRTVRRAPRASRALTRSKNPPEDPLLK